jgi:hypothetical protein
LPADIADALEAGGFLPKPVTLTDIIVAFQRLKEASAKAAQVADLDRNVEEAFPLKALLPLSVSYRVGLDAAERGLLAAFKVGGRWFRTKREMNCWLAATGRSQL